MDQTGQDSYDILLTDLGENIRFFGVYDGHGIKGKYAANFVKDEIRKELILNQNNIGITSAGGSIGIYTDNETGVEYFVYSSLGVTGVAICPSVSIGLKKPLGNSPDANIYHYKKTSTGQIISL